MVGLGFAFYFCLKLKYYAFVNLNEKLLLNSGIDVTYVCRVVQSKRVNF